MSTRTIYRDVDVIFSAGVLIFTNKGSGGGGISLLENYSHVKVTNEVFKRRQFSDNSRRDETENILSLVCLKLKFYSQALYRLYDDFDDEIIVRNVY